MNVLEDRSGTLHVMPYDPELAERVFAALVRNKAVVPSRLVEKKMFGGVAYMLADAMTVGVIKEDLIIRVTANDAAQYLELPHVRPMDFTGKPMRGWLYVNADAVPDDASLDLWVERAVRFVRSLPAKRLVTAKKKPAAKGPSKIPRG